jgi:hypothetical protein
MEKTMEQIAYWILSFTVIYFTGHVIYALFIR